MSGPVFLRSAARPSDFPADEGLEVAVVGRSNSGKSTAINCIAGSAKLARVSKTPGRTQLINFFEIAHARRLVDLPGYGYARVSPATQRRWQALVEAYFGGRESLVGLVITCDIRRGLMDLDAAMIAWTHKLGIPTLLLLTKADKLSRGAALAQQRLVASAAAPQNLLFSAVTNQGVPEARRRLAAWLQMQ